MRVEGKQNGSHKQCSEDEDFSREKTVSSREGKCKQGSERITELLH